MNCKSNGTGAANVETASSEGLESLQGEDLTHWWDCDLNKLTLFAKLEMGLSE